MSETANNPQAASPSITKTKRKRSLPRLAPFQKEMVLVIALGSSVFFLLALFSFSLNDNTPFAVSFPPRPTHNWAGEIGAWLAGYSVYAFGLVSFVLPLPFLVSSLCHVCQVPKSFAPSRFLGWLLFLGFLMTTAHLVQPTMSLEGVHLYTGGIWGKKIAVSLSHTFGPYGLYVLGTTILAAAVLLITRREIIGPALRAWRTRRMEAATQEADTDANASTRPSLWARLRAKMTTRDDAEPAAPRVTSVPTAITEPMTIAVAEPIPMAAHNTGPQEPVPFFTHDAEPAPREPLAAPPLQSIDDEDNHLHLPNSLIEAQATATPYERPPNHLFKTNAQAAILSEEKRREFEATAENIVKAFDDFGIKGKVVAIQPGPVVTVYEYQANAGTKLAKIASLTDDIALALKVDSIFIHPVSGKQAVGIQVPNNDRETVYLGDVLRTEAFEKSSSPLTFAMGKSLKGEPLTADLAAMPHLLMAGQTGSGKSVAINALICSMIMKASPEDLKMILVDPKILELKTYEGIPHLLMPVITEPAKASLALKWACDEMERRYRLLEMAKVRHISGFNAYWENASPAEKTRLREAMGDDHLEKLPFLMVVIDELADLMLTAPKDVEASIQRLAQKARASGIHLVLATQRPSVDVITGVIKANLPCRVAFKVFARVDSRTILDSMGAEKLLGKGDMLFLKPGSAKLIRIQGAFLEDQEVVNLVEWLKTKSGVNYDERVISWIEDEFQRTQGDDKNGGNDAVPLGDDPKWDESLHIAQSQGYISASYLQRQLKIGYNRAARIVEAMERQGLVAKADGAKPRKWLGLKNV